MRGSDQQRIHRQLYAEQSNKHLWKPKSHLAKGLLYLPKQCSVSGTAGVEGVQNKQPGFQQPES